MGGFVLCTAECLSCGNLSDCRSDQQLSRQSKFGSGCHSKQHKFGRWTEYGSTTFWLYILSSVRSETRILFSNSTAKAAAGYTDDFVQVAFTNTMASDAWHYDSFLMDAIALATSAGEILAPFTLTLYYSTDNVTYTKLVGATYTTTTRSTSLNPAEPYESMGDNQVQNLVDLAPGQTDYFRLGVSDGATTTGTTANRNAIFIDNIQLNATTVPVAVPESSCAMLLLVGAFGFLCIRRCRLST